MAERVRKKRRKSHKCSQAWLQRLQAVESPDVTFVGERFPIVMKRARGLLVTDVDGHRYHDFTACFGVLALGHRHPVVLNAVRRQTAKLIHGMGDVHPTEAKVRLLETLVAMTPFSDGKCLLGLNGSDAVDAALKTAMVITGRHRFVAFAGAYHGLSLGPLALCDRDHFRRGFEPWIESHSVTLPFPGGSKISRSSALGESEIGSDIWSTHEMVPAEQVLVLLEDALRGRNVAAVVMEPVQGRGGEREWPDGFVRECAFLAKKYGTLLIFDEIFTGLGRTGDLWGHQALGVTPDLMCVGKALGGGFPLSACVGSGMDAWGKTTGEARHTSTFLGHPLACAVGRQVLLAIARRLPEWQAALPAIDQAFADFARQYRAEGLDARFPFVLRGRGFMRGLWFFRSQPGFAATLAEDLLEEGFVVLPSGPRGDVLSLTPSLVATAKDFTRILNAVRRVIATK